jgi:hypothetical protein
MQEAVLAANAADAGKRPGLLEVVTSAPSYTSDVAPGCTTGPVAAGGGTLRPAGLVPGNER